MGFKFSAIATTDTFSANEMDSFSCRFFCNRLMFEKEVYLEESMTINYNIEYIDILFLEKGTLIFGASPKALEKLDARKNSFGNKTGSFAVEETSMVYTVDYFENIETKISLIEFNGNKINKQINNFGIAYSNGFDLMIELIKSIIGSSIYELEPGLKLSRYKFTNEAPGLSEADKKWLVELNNETDRQTELRDQYDHTSPYINGVAKARIGNKYGLIDESGKKLSRFKYDSIEDVEHGGIARCSVNSKWGYVNSKGEEFIPADYDEIKPFAEGLAAVKNNNKYGFINMHNNTVIPLQYEYAGHFKNGFAAVKLNDKYGFINPSGNEMTAFIYDDTWGYNGECAFVYLNNTWSAIDINGNILRTFDYEQVFAWNSTDELISVQNDGLWGCIDRNFNLKIPCIYNTWLIFNEGLSPVSRSMARKSDPENVFERISYVNLNGEEIIPYLYDEGGLFKNGMAKVRSGDKWGYIDTGGNLAIPLLYDVAQDFENGIAIVESNSKKIKINAKGEEQPR
ncbi:WG repeat-containing protein [Ferruginibacter sp. SUN106]|uniref:WG repeat-containing protein n=1 Tax=Ferruginibacter sp. SUN106 TaxID=2978348 RepID=UPI003D36E498